MGDGPQGILGEKTTLQVGALETGRDPGFNALGPQGFESGVDCRSRSGRIQLKRVDMRQYIFGSGQDHLKAQLACSVQQLA